MKINTDGVLLGAMAQLDGPERILDIGTGTGVIALMLAQRFSNALVDAVEIDAVAAQTAALNFSKSAFTERLTLYPGSFQNQLINHTEKKYDLIVSNPPFYINSLVSPKADKNLAKHTDAHFFNDLISYTLLNLTDTGLLWLILPVDTAGLVKIIASENGFHLRQIITVKSYPESEPHREILSLGRYQTKTIETEFVIYNAPKQYTGQYRTALHSFLTIFQ